MEILLCHDHIKQQLTQLTVIFRYYKKTVNTDSRNQIRHFETIFKLTSIILHSFGRFGKVSSVETQLSIVHQVQSLKYSKFLEISASLFNMLIGILGFVYFVLLVSFRKDLYVLKRLFVMDPMKSRFAFFQLS